MPQPLHLAYVSLGDHRGHRRLWLEGRHLEDAGFTPATRYVAVLDAAVGRLRLVRSLDGDRMVSQRQREGGDVRPIIDIANAFLDRVLGDRRRARVQFSDGEIEITIHHLDRKAERRAAKAERLRSGGEVRTGGICVGVGVLDAAIHEGLEEAGLSARSVFAVEIDPRYQAAMLANNRRMGGTCSVLGNLDEVEPEILPECDVLLAGIPCTAASLAGRAKKGAGVPERDEDVGHLIVSFLEVVKASMPVAVVLENVVPYKHTASYHIAMTALSRLGYRLHEAELDGVEFGAMERRKRLCLLAVDPSLPEDVLEGVSYPPASGKTMGDILEVVPEDDERWKDISYLVAKETRDLEDGHNFRRQLVAPEDSSVGVVGRQYWKWRSTEPMVAHPHKPNFARLLSPREHAAVKGVDPGLVSNLPWTTAHEVLGQGVIPAAFRSIGVALGRGILSARSDRPSSPDLPLFACAAGAA
jgi:DNA (cytosine-5)-methyltransferase 1